MYTPCLHFRGDSMREYESPQAQYKHLQRRLIPVNFVVAILSLVAAISILFMPLLRIDIDPAALSEAMGGGTSSEESAEEGTDASPLSMLSGMELQASFSGMDFATLCFSDDMFGTLFATVGKTLSENASALASNVLVASVAENVGEEAADVAEKVTRSLDELSAAKTDAEVDETIDELVGTLFDELALENADRDEMAETIRKMYDETAQENEGVFTTEAFICVTVSKAMNESGTGESGEGGAGGGTGEVYTNFTDLATNMLGAEGGMSDMTDAFPSFVFTIVGAVMIAFAGVWAILFLFAFFHMFAKNKRFTMWYVKLFGFLPCLLFGVVPLVLPLIMKNATVAALCGMISSLSWISGACYLLLWIVSIFWAFPIKRKIRKLKSEIA